jgi:TolB-like protein
MKGKQLDQAKHRPNKAAHPYLPKLLAAVPRGTIVGRQEREVMGEFREDSGNSPKSAEDAGRITAFGDVRFNIESGELHRDGRTTRLTPKAAAVLAALLEKAPGLVTKEELLSGVWGGRAVGDEAITSCIQEVRRALDDDARNPRYIETRYRRGYRLLAALDAKSFANGLNALGAGTPILALPDKPSIAVLPFLNMTGDPEQDYFIDGVTEDIITELSRFHSLFVIARNSSFSYKGKSPDVRQIGRELGVRYVLEGSIRRSLNRIRVTAQLIDTLTANHIWAERYDRVLEDIFAVQVEVTQAIVAAIAPEIESTEQSKAARRRPDNLIAHEIALRATAHAPCIRGRRQGGSNTCRASDSGSKGSAGNRPDQRAGAIGTFTFSRDSSAPSNGDGPEASS